MKAEACNKKYRTYIQLFCLKKRVIIIAIKILSKSSSLSKNRRVHFKVQFSFRERHEDEIGISRASSCMYAFHLCTFSRACVRKEERSVNDSWGMHLGCNCDGEVACFPKGCLFSLPLCHLYPSCAPGRLSFLVLSCGTSLKFMDYSQRARKDGERVGSINRCS